jgi:acetylornithine deacetylase
MNGGSEEAVLAWIDDRKEDLVGLACEMVRIPSVSGAEGPLASYLQAWLSNNGFETELRNVPAEFQARFPDFASEKHLDSRPNLYVRLPGAHEATAEPIVINGHLDVVPVGDVEKWRVPPFSGTRSDGMIWGRGAADMKGPIAAALTALLALKRCVPSLKKDILFHLVIGEETGGIGSLFALSDQRRPSCTIVLEPSQSRVVTAGAGSVQFTVRAKGKAAHGCAPWEGRSALTMLLRCLGRIEAYAALRNAELRHDLFAEHPQQAPLSIGTFNCGDWRATVPESGEFSGRLGLLPGELIETVRLELEHEVELCREEMNVAPDELSIDWPNLGFPAWETPSSAPVVRALVNAAHRLNSTTQPTGVMFGSDAGHYATKNVPVAIFGPGDIAVAHMVDEHISEEALVHAAKILALAVLGLSQCPDSSDGTRREE